MNLMKIVPPRPTDVASNLTLMLAAPDLRDALEAVLPDLRNEVQARVDALFQSDNLTAGERCFNAAILRQAQQIQAKIDAAEAAIKKSRAR